MSGITHAEWQKALGDAVTPPDPDAFTATELARMFGISRSNMETRIRRLVDEKKAIRTAKLLTDVNGHRKRVTAYKLVTDATRPATRRR